MIRIMNENDWDRIVRIYNQSLQKGDVTFITESQNNKEWDADMDKNAVYKTNSFYWDTKGNEFLGATQYLTSCGLSAINYCFVE